MSVLAAPARRGLLSWGARVAGVVACCLLTGVWFLLVGGVRPVGELQRLRRRGRMRDSDADQLGRLTRTGALFWVGFFFLVTLGVLVIGTFMLAGRFIDELPSAG